MLRRVAWEDGAHAPSVNSRREALHGLRGRLPLRFRDADPFRQHRVIELHDVAAAVRNERPAEQRRPRAGSFGSV